MRLLLAVGVDDQLVEQLLLMDQHLLRTHSHRRATTGGAGGREGGSQDDRGEIQVSTAELCGRVAPPEIIRHNLDDVLTRR